MRGYRQEVLCPSKLKTEGPHKVIIFDWDDTICPSSYVDCMKVERVNQLPRHLQKLFAEISRLAARMLHEASKYGEVMLITNSDDGWVKYSCERFLPDLIPVLQNYRIVSARSLYERFYPRQPLCWKAAAFAHEVNEMYKASMPSNASSSDLSTDSENDASQLSLESTDVSAATTDDEDSAMDEGEDGDETRENIEGRCSAKRFAMNREIVSFGDSVEEKTAVWIVAGQLQAMPKSVMFIQLPSPLQILGQLQMVINHMGFVCNNKSRLDLEISPEQAEYHADMYLRKRRLGSSRHYQQHPSRTTKATSSSSSY